MSNKHLSFDDRLIIEENNKLQNVLTKAYEEIDRLKSQINNKNDDNKYILKKLTNQFNKNSFDSGIPTSKEIKKLKLVLIHITIERKVIAKMVDSLGIKAKL